MSDNKDLLEGLTALVNKLASERETAQVNRDSSTDFQIHKPGYEVKKFITELFDRTEEVRELNALKEYVAYRDRDLRRTIGEDEVVSASARNMMGLAPTIDVPQNQ